MKIPRELKIAQRYHFSPRPTDILVASAVSTLMNSSFAIQGRDPQSAATNAQARQGRAKCPHVQIQQEKAISTGTLLAEKCKLTSAVVEGGIVPNKYQVKAAGGLLKAQDSILIVIDVQAAFARKLRPVDAQGIALRTGWLIGTARWLDIPVLVTAEDLSSLGGPIEEVARWLAADAVIHNKLVFDLTEEPDIVKAVRDTGRHSAVLAGFETDVCVAQSAIGLMRHGYRVVALADCSGSPGSAHTAGLERMASEGALILPMRSVLYEWLGTVERSQRFRTEFVSRHPLPEGLIL